MRIRATRLQRFGPAGPAILLCAVLGLAGCASIPAEAPELSAQLGSRITAMEVAHRQLLGDFFREKKRRVDEFVQTEWVPVFAGELFKDPKVSRVWDEVVRGGDPAERLRFITTTGPLLQQQINAKRSELIQPLEELEATILGRLKAEYDTMRAINSSLTAFLQSAAQVEQNRKRYLDTIGIAESQVDAFIFETDRAVASLAGTGRSAQDRVRDAEAYKQRIDALISRLRKGS